ncbi:MAG: hypothetical protein ABR540_16335 [Acidimicrobiales bacterium]
MSPRAAWRLETLGFTDAYDYVGGKVDWFGAGWPREGSGRIIRLVDLADRSVPTCGLGEQAGAVLGRLGEWDVCIPVNQERVVLGVVGVDALEAGDDRAVGEVMDPAPSTWRPHLSVKRGGGPTGEQPPAAGGRDPIGRAARGCGQRTGHFGGGHSRRPGGLRARPAVGFAAAERGGISP